MTQSFHMSQNSAGVQSKKWLLILIAMHMWYTVVLPEWDTLKLTICHPSLGCPPYSVCLQSNIWSRKTKK